MAVAASLLLQLVVVYTQFLNGPFQTTPLDLNDWALILGCGALVLLVEEIRKGIVRSVQPDAPS